MDFLDEKLRKKRGANIMKNKCIYIIKMKSVEI